MMDYAATFCGYSGTERAPRPAAARAGKFFPPAMSVRTILTGSAIMHVALLWAILSLSLGAVDDFRSSVLYLGGAAVISAACTFYWFVSGIFTVKHIFAVESNPLPFALLVNSFAGVALALGIFAAAVHPELEDAVTGGIVATVAVLLLAAGFGKVTRLFVRHAIRHQRLACDIIIAGDQLSMRGFIRHMRENHASVRICAAFALSGPVQGQDIDDVPLHRGISELLSFHAHYPNPRVILMPAKRHRDFEMTLDMLRLQPLHVLALHENYVLDDGLLESCSAGVPGIKLTILQVPPLSAFAFFFKDFFDRAAGIAALVAFAPVMLGCAAAIKLTSPGPVLYRQARIGYRNKIFHVYKFRSMHLTDCDKLTLTKRGDSRVFAAGRFMRRLSLDELPQLFNVIRGEMSLVGPRPHMPEARAGERLYYEVVENYGSRHRVKPGITGWAQINGWRGPTDTEESILARVEHDFYYIKNWSFWLDLQIIFRTAFGGFSGHNAV